MKHKGAHSNILIVDARWRDDNSPFYLVSSGNLLRNKINET